MKKFFFVGALLLLALQACAQGGSLKVSGNVKDLGNRLVYYVYDLNAGTWTKPDTVELSPDKPFQFIVQLAGVGNLLMYGFTAGSSPAMSLNIRIPAIPGEELRIGGSLGSLTYDGTPFYHDYGLASEAISRAGDVASIGREVAAAQKSGVGEDSLVALRNARMADYNRKVAQAVFGFIATHPASEASVLVLDRLLPADFFHADSLLSASAKTGRAKTFYEQARARAERAVKVEQARKLLAVGAAAPEFSLPGLDGKPIALSSLRGKYVVLDFWGSWCGWCIKGFPQMKEYYAKYKDKLEILGIDCRDTEQRWRDAVAKYELPWPQVRNTDQTAVEVKYAVTGYPTKVVIDPQGRIARIVVGEDPKFYDYIDSLMK